MKIVQTHIECYDRSPPGRKDDGPQDACYKKNIFSFKQECRYDKIIDNIIVCRDENQITEFDGHRFGKTDRIRPENDHPKDVDGHPKKNVKKIRSDWQYSLFIQK